MRDDEIKSIFDQQASTYDDRWAKTAPIRDALHFLLESVFAGLPDEARVLCVGAGTGEERRAFPPRGWSRCARLIRATLRSFRPRGWRPSSNLAGLTIR